MAQASGGSHGQLTHWFPAQQGLKRYTYGQRVNRGAILLTDFQHNKDWNQELADQGLQDADLLTDFQHNKDWNYEAGAPTA